LADSVLRRKLLLSSDSLPTPQRDSVRKRLNFSVATP
jgi:hypothetical protein